MSVPCGKCMACLESRRVEWSFRLTQEYSVSSSAYFFTFTYADSYLLFNVASRLAELCLRDVQLFLKKLRKRVAEKFPDVRIRYYVVGEYGDVSYRPHYHAIVFNLPAEFVGLDELDLTAYPDGVMINDSVVARCWRGGLVHAGSVTGASIFYVAKYHVNKGLEFPGRAPPFCVMSRRPGIGSSYVATGRRWQRSEGGRTYVVSGEFKMKLPRYYREKMFSKPERELLAARMMELVEDRAQKEFERVFSIHPDPFRYREELQRQAYDRISMKNPNDKRLKL